MANDSLILLYFLMIAARYGLMIAARYGEGRGMWGKNGMYSALFTLRTPIRADRPSTL